MNSDIDPRLDHYKTLGVAADASAADIKKAYRNLAKKYHPDSTGGDKAKEARFKEIGQAYDVLGDADKRAKYDTIRASAAQFGGAGAGFPGGFSGAWSNQGDVDLGDLFAQMFGGGARPGAGGPGGNVNVRFSQGGSPFGAGPSPFGADIPFETTRRTRRKPATSRTAERKVRLSDGSTVTQRGQDIHSELRLTLDKAILGTVAEVPTLDGKAKVKVPPGTSSGVKLRLRGKGARAADGNRGDQYVTIQIDVPSKIDEEAKKLLVRFMQRVKQ
jgi:DnaJ-class molecular chaperone